MHFPYEHSITDLTKHETKRRSLWRFVALLGIVIVYFIFMSYKFGAGAGLYSTILTWSFFVLCTPVADAGFLLAFPVRLVSGVRMLYTQIFAYIISITFSIYTLSQASDMFEKTSILKLFKHILTQPFPYWGIIILSFVGTLLSIHFGDEAMDVTLHSERTKYHKHKNKYRFIAFIFLIAFTIILYDFLLKKLGVEIKV